MIGTFVNQIVNNDTNGANVGLHITHPVAPPMHCKYGWGHAPLDAQKVT
jgi:hypothetical protein